MERESPLSGITVRDVKITCVVGAIVIAIVAVISHSSGAHPSMQAYPSSYSPPPAPKPAAAPKRWYAANQGMDGCIETTLGPAGLIDAYRDSNPTTHDYRSNTGELYRVDVSVEAGGDFVRTWHLYASESACIDGEIRPVDALANKYR